MFFAAAASAEERQERANKAVETRGDTHHK